MIIKKVLFDFGGVVMYLKDPKPREALAARYNTTVDELINIVYLQESAQLATLGKMKAKEHWEKVREKFELSHEELKTFQSEFWGGDKIDWALIEFIRGLHPHYTTALLSNAWDDLRSAMVNDWKIIDVFQHVFISAELGIAKPGREIYQYVIEQLGCEPHEAVFLDDMPKNVGGAREAGLNAIHFRSREQALGELRELLDNEL